MISAWASARLPDVIREKTPGETVNVHVVEFAKEPQPDFAEMQRVISGEDRPLEDIEPPRDGTR